MIGTNDSERTITRERLLDERVALVTGGSRGIGAATSVLLGTHGAAVGVNYRSSAQHAEQVVDKIRQTGSAAVAVQGDVGKEDDVATMVDVVREQLGPIDTLVLNSAGHSGGFTPRPLVEYEMGVVWTMLWEQIHAVFAPCKAALHDMIERQSGCVILVGSGMSSSPQPSMGLLSIAKAAADALARVLALELGPLGIRVNVVAPGFVETETSQRFVPPAARQALANSTPLRRTAVPDDVAGMILMLASDYASYVSGRRICLTGGSA